MSSPANHVLRQPGQAVPGAGGASLVSGFPSQRRSAGIGERSSPRPTPSSPTPPSPTNPSPTNPSGAPDAAVLRIRCGAEGFALARSFTRDTLRRWSLDHRGDDAALVITELAANAVAHAVPQALVSEAEVWLGIALEPAHVHLTVSDPGEDPPEFTTADGDALLDHGRGLFIVDALAEEWGWTLTPPAGKTVWARLSTCPPT
ncbi:ATP-binding protein [Streptomyces sp. NPDC050997]|uniref:ATP-binding protein n=1 Tax=Streptomyces sp. NPDC050997 TaxID=3155519 RepID=UPI00341635E0